MLRPSRYGMKHRNLMEKKHEVKDLKAHLNFTLLSQVPKTLFHNNMAVNLPVQVPASSKQSAAIVQSPETVPQAVKRSTVSMFFFQSIS